MPADEIVVSQINDLVNTWRLALLQTQVSIINGRTLLGWCHTMTADERVEQIRLKVDRARKHFHDLKVEIDSFLATNPYVIGTKRNLQTQQLIYFLEEVHQTPLEISTILGDTIHNLRSALDHLAYQLVWLETGKIPSDHIYFPIADDAVKYQQKRQHQVKGAPPQAISAIDALQPYKGGNDVLWKLHALNNIDKHRALIIIGSAYHSINLGAHISRQLQHETSSNPDFAHLSAFSPLDAFFRPADRMFPLKQGDELFIDSPNAKVDKHLQFRFHIALGESFIVGEPVIEAVQPMIDLVDNIVLQFKPWLA